MNKKFWIRFSVMMAIIVAVLVLDLVTKYVFDATLSFNETKTIIPYLFNFKLVHNIGAAWGLLAGKQVFLIALSLVFLAIFIAYYVKEKNKTWLLNVTFGFLIGGCLGNLYDRIFVGYVRDFIQFAFWESFPIFNFADAALSIGVVLFVIYLVLYFVKLKKAEKVAGILIEKESDQKEETSNADVSPDKEKPTKRQKKDVEKSASKNSDVQKKPKNPGKMQKNEEKLSKNPNSKQKHSKTKSKQNGEDEQ